MTDEFDDEFDSDFNDEGVEVIRLRPMAERDAIMRELFGSGATPPEPTKPKGVPTEHWIPHKPFDWVEYLDRPDPVYEGDDPADETEDA